MAKSSELLERVKHLVEPVLDRESYELVDVEFVSDRGRQILRMYIDLIPPGTLERSVGVEDCSKVSRVVSDLLDVEEPLAGHYHLEVSSPGLFRPLTKAEHFARSVGERVRVKTFEKLGDRKVFTGILREFAEGKLRLEVDGVDCSVELRQISRANLEPDLSRRGEGTR